MFGWVGFVAMAGAQPPLHVEEGRSVVLTTPAPVIRTELEGHPVVEVRPSGDDQSVWVVGLRPGSTVLQVVMSEKTVEYDVRVGPPAPRRADFELTRHEAILVTVPGALRHSGLSDPTVATWQPSPSHAERFLLTGREVGSSDLVAFRKGSAPQFYSVEVTERPPRAAARLTIGRWVDLDLAPDGGPPVVANPAFEVREHRGRWQGRFIESGWTSAVWWPATGSAWVRTYATGELQGIADAPGRLPTPEERRTAEQAAISAFETYLERWKAGEPEGWGSALPEETRGAIPQGALPAWPAHIDVDVLGAFWVSGDHVVVAYSPTIADTFSVKTNLATLTYRDEGWKVLLDDPTLVADARPLHVLHSQPSKHGLNPVGVPQQGWEVRATKAWDRYHRAASRGKWDQAVRHVDRAHLRELHDLLQQSAERDPEPLSELLERSPAQLWTTLRAQIPAEQVRPAPTPIAVTQGCDQFEALVLVRHDDGQWGVERVRRTGPRWSAVPDRLLDGLLMVGLVAKTLGPTE